MTLLNDCSGKVALITGAATGIGRSCAQKLAEAGARVIASDIDAEGLQKTVALITEAGGTARACEQDVAEESVWQNIIADIKAQEGALHVLVNNAGIAIGASILEMSLDDWRRQSAINLDGVFLGCKHAIPLMAESGAVPLSIFHQSPVCAARPDWPVIARPKAGCGFCRNLLPRNALPPNCRSAAIVCIRALSTRIFGA